MLSISRLSRDTLYIPSVGALVSFEVLFLRFFLSWIRGLFRSNTVTDEHGNVEQYDQNQPSPSFREKLSLHVRRHGGPVTFWYQVLRLVCGLVLFALTVLNAYCLERVNPKVLLVEQYEPLMFGWVQRDTQLDLSLGVTYVSHILDLGVS